MNLQHTTGYFLALDNEGNQRWRLYRIIAGNWGSCELVESGTLQHLSNYLHTLAEKVSPLSDSA